jgi:hypothetical protein
MLLLLLGEVIKMPDLCFIKVEHLTSVMQKRVARRHADTVCA